MGHTAILPGSGLGLPAEVTGFVGRRRDRARIRQLMSASRLVTLTGFGGIGKTRLALRMANELSRAYPDGVWWVPLGDLSDPHLIAEASAAAMGLRDPSTKPGAGPLAEHLRDRELLLVLDNCEHLIEECADLAATLLKGCPGVHILATSREALRVDGEAVYVVSPLSVPDAEVRDLDAAPDYEAVRLLTDRASHVAPGFVFTRENRSVIVEICRHLDGIPLAIELAAVRLRATAPAELLEQLRGHLSSLDVGTRGAPDRHRTMTACLEWSYGLCTPEERNVWAALSVFTGGVEMDAIQYVASRQSPAFSPEQIIQIVQALVDKSILTREMRDDHARYRMLEVLRHFGVARLEDSGGLQSARTYHRDWYAELTQRLDEDWMTPGQTAMLSRIRHEEANLRRALDFCAAQPGESELGLEMAARMRRYIVSHGYFSEGRVWLHQLLADAPDPNMVRLRGLHAACWLAAMQGDRQAADTLLAECRELAGELEEPARGLADQVAGVCALFRGDLAPAAEQLQLSLDGLRGHENAAPRVESLVTLGMTLGFAGELERAVDAHAQCQAMCTSAGESWYLSYSLWHQGLVIWRQGDVTRAVELENESLRLKRTLGEGVGVALCVEALAWITVDASPPRAATLLGAAHALRSATGSSVSSNPGLVPYHQDCRHRLAELLGKAAFDEAFDGGARMDGEEMIAYALEERRAATPVPTGGASDNFSPTKLTKREREIAELVATGLSNKEVAGKLVISRRTVETHVENILTKLGFTSRTQVALWVSNHQAESHTR